MSPRPFFEAPELGVLTSIRYAIFSGLPFPVGVELGFELGEILVAAREETDEIADTFNELISDRMELVDHIEPWAEVIGGRCLWSWELTNQMGFRDGVQFEFVSDKSRVRVQLLVGASMIRVGRVFHLPGTFA